MTDETRLANGADLSQVEKMESVVAQKQASQRGGKRTGSGRKPRENHLVAFTFRLDDEHARAFRSVCEKNGLSQSRQIALWVGKENKKTNKK